MFTTNNCGWNATDILKIRKIKLSNKNSAFGVWIESIGDEKND